MSKRLKLAGLSASRTLRSGRIVNTDSSEKTSPYFGEKRLTGTKKRIPIKIEHEATENETNVKETPVVIKSEDVEMPTDVKDIKIEEREKSENVELTDPKKKRTPIKIEYEAMEKETNVKGINVAPVIKNEDEEKKTSKDIKIEECEIKSENVEQSRIKNSPQNDEDKKQWMPPNWEIIFENIKEMRKHKTAPVDAMGCQKCADPNANPIVSRYQSLIALMLSSQTKDQVTHAAMQRLNTYGCKPDIIAATPDDVLGKLIYPVGFWKVKITMLIYLQDTFKSHLKSLVKVK